MSVGNVSLIRGHNECGKCFIIINKSCNLQYHNIIHFFLVIYSLSIIYFINNKQFISEMLWWIYLFVSLLTYLSVAFFAAWCRGRWTCIITSCWWHWWWRGVLRLVQPLLHPPTPLALRWRGVLHLVLPQLQAPTPKNKHPLLHLLQLVMVLKTGDYFTYQWWQFGYNLDTYKHSAPVITDPADESAGSLDTSDEYFVLTMRTMQLSGCEI